MWPSAARIAAAETSWYVLRRPRRSSGSSLPDSSVEPTRSQNITVSWRRSASESTGPCCGPEAGVGLDGAARSGPRAPPQSRQAGAPAGFDAPHEGQGID